jgi:hypothetical protein
MVRSRRVRATTAAVVVAGSLSGCGWIIGLDEFTDQPPPGGGGGGHGGGAAGGCSAAADCPGGEHGTPTCDAGACGLQCDEGFGDCDGAPVRGGHDGRPAESAAADLARRTARRGAATRRSPTAGHRIRAAEDDAWWGQPGRGARRRTTEDRTTPTQGSPGLAVEIAAGHSRSRCSRCGTDALFPDQARDWGTTVQQMATPRRAAWSAAPVAGGLRARAGSTRAWSPWTRDCSPVQFRGTGRHNSRRHCRLSGKCFKGQRRHRPRSYKDPMTAAEAAKYVRRRDWLQEIGLARCCHRTYD